MFDSLKQTSTWGSALSIVLCLGLGLILISYKENYDERSSKWTLDNQKCIIENFPKYKSMCKTIQFCDAKAGFTHPGDTTRWYCD